MERVRRLQLSLYLLREKFQTSNEKANAQLPEMLQLRATFSSGKAYAAAAQDPGRSVHMGVFFFRYYLRREEMDGSNFRKSEAAA